jgi:hypothetical protein
VARHVRTRRFDADWQALTSDQRKAFVAAILNFDADLASTQFRPSLGVNAVQGVPGAYEMSWAADGRATFEFGQPASPDNVVIWRRVGSREGFRRP